MSDNKADRELLKQQADTLYGLYEAKSRSFRRAFIGVAILATAVFGLVIWPYTNFRGEQFRLEARAVVLQQQLRAARTDEAEFSVEVAWFEDTRRAVHEEVEKTLNGVNEAYQAHRRNLETARSILQENPEADAWLAGDAERPELTEFTLATDPRLREFDQDECFWFDGERWDRCLMARSLVQFGLVARPYEYRRDSHLRNELREPLHDELTALTGRFGNWLDAGAGSWRADDDTTRDRRLDELYRFGDEYRRQVGEHLNELKNRRWQLEKNVKQLEEEIAATETNIAGLREKIAEIDSLENINTPLGALPIGLNDFVMVFPLLLAAGFYLCVSLFFDSLRLRRSFHRISRSLNPEIFSDEYVALVAPLWIDPVKGFGQSVLRTLILFLPAFVFLASMILLLKNRLLWGEFMAEVRLSAWVYYAAYLLSVGLFVEGARRVSRILRY